MLRIIATVIFLRFNILLSSAQSEQLSGAMVIFRAKENIEAAIEQFTAQLDADQPVCFDTNTNYIKCLSFPDDIRGSVFYSHKDVPRFNRLEDTKSVIGYNMIASTYWSLRPGTCREIGKWALVPYQWYTEDGGQNTGFALARDFIAGDGNPYFCTSGPIGFEDFSYWQEIQHEVPNKKHMM